MTVTVPESYNLLPVGGGTKPLTDPATLGHANLHDRVSASIENLRAAVAALVEAGPQVAADIDQARLSALVWTVPGNLVAAPGVLLLPVLWNLTGRAVEFEAARISCFTPPAGSDVLVDLVVSGEISSGTHTMNLDPSLMTKITAAPLRIVAGTNFSDAATAFATNQPRNSYVGAVVRAVGSSQPGANLTIQLNRKL